MTAIDDKWRQIPWIGQPKGEGAGDQDERGRGLVGHERRGSLKQQRGLLVRFFVVAEGERCRAHRRRSSRARQRRAWT